MNIKQVKMAIFLPKNGNFTKILISFHRIKIQNTLRVVHSPVVEKLPVVDKTLPPNNFYLAKVPSSGQFPVVDKKSGISIRFCCSLFYDNLLFTAMHTFITISHSFSLWSWVKLRREVIQFYHLMKALLKTIQLWQEIHPEGQPESAWEASHWWKTIQLPPLW